MGEFPRLALRDELEADAERWRQAFFRTEDAFKMANKRTAALAAAAGAAVDGWDTFIRTDDFEAASEAIAGLRDAFNTAR